MSRKSWCKNYRGMYKHEACEANVRFDSLPLYGTKEFHEKCPCFGDVGGCEKAKYPTDEEIKAAESEILRRFEEIGAARTAIVDSLGGPWRRGSPGASGSIDCPICHGDKSLQFSRASVNGHIHARCKTPKCVSWME